MTRNRALVIAVTLAASLVAAPASADITGFLGLSGGPSVRGAKGVAVGFGFLIVGLEFEYGDTSEDVADGAPHVQTGSLNLLLQTPAPIGGVQVYGTAGAGGYHHELGAISETNASVNLGGGAKIKVIGPLRLRVDYRFFHFLGAPIGDGNVHRVYFGANLNF